MTFDDGLNLSPEHRRQALDLLARIDAEPDVFGRIALRNSADYPMEVRLAALLVDPDEIAAGLPTDGQTGECWCGERLFDDDETCGQDACPAARGR